MMLTAIRSGMARRLCLAMLLCAFPALAAAGGYLSLANDGTVRAWSGTITVRPDLGDLGLLTNAQADTMLANALAVWEGVGTSNVDFAIGADLASDQTGSNAALTQTGGDGISPIAYDDDGSLVNLILGAGQNQVVVGFAGIQSLSGNTIFDGRAVMNGLFWDGAGSPTDVASLDIYTGVLVHELGHFLNLDHAQCNSAYTRSINNTAVPQNFDGFPTMYPLVHDDILTLELDDEVWLSNLYPSAGFLTGTSAMSGTVFDTDGSTLLNGVNIVARRTDDPINSVITCVSGFDDPDDTTGNYLIPGLTPGTTWVLDFEPIRSNFAGGSSVGIVDPPLVIASPVEFINEAAVEDETDNVLVATSFIAPAGGDTLPGLDLVLNTPPAVNNVAEVDIGFGPDDQTLTLTPGVTTVVSGTIDSADASDVFDVEDWFVISPDPSASLELIRITLDPGPSADVRLLVANRNGGSFSGFAFDSGGAGAAETFDDILDTARFSTGVHEGHLYIGVDGLAGADSYTLTIESSHANSAVPYLTSTTAIDPSQSPVIITGSHFNNDGGTPLVTFSDPNISVDSVTYNSSTQLTVAISDAGGFTPGSSDVTVTNQNSNYAGKLAGAVTVPVEVSGYSID